MARFLFGVVAGMVITTVAGAAAGLHAQSSEDEVAAASSEAGVDSEALRGAMNSTGLDPYTYLRSTGELPTQQNAPVVAPVSAAPPGGIWQKLAQCESTGNWRANTGNSYYGGLQQDMTFWRKYGGLAYAARPDLATPAQQIAVAQRGLAVQGARAWPVCSVRVGLR